MLLVWLTLFIQIFLLSLELPARTRTFIMTGNPDARNSQDVYANDLAHIVDSIDSMGPMLWASPKEGQEALRKKNPSIRSLPTADIPDKTEIDRLLRNFAKGMAPGETLLIPMLGHGLPPQTKQGEVPDALDATIEFWGKRVSYRDLLTEFQEFQKTPPGSHIKIKFVSEVCFPGVHVLARRLKNSCAVSQTAFTEKSYLPPGATQNPFNEAFYRHIKENPNVSLAKAATAAFDLDYNNKNLGRLSSTDFIDSKLQQGPHSQRYLASYLRDGPIDAYDSKRRRTEIRSSLTLSLGKEFYFNPWGGRKTCGISADKPEFKIPDLNQIKVILAAVLNKTVEEFTGAQKENISENLYTEAIAYLEKFGPKLPGLLEQIQQRSEVLANRRKRAVKNDEIAGIHQSLKELETRAQELLAPYVRAIRIANHTESLARFTAVATQEDKQKLAELAFIVQLDEIGQGERPAKSVRVLNRVRGTRKANFF